MLNETQNQQWKTTQKDLENLVCGDYENQALEPTIDRPEAQKLVFELYVKYICIANSLESIYDDMLQPQKRLLIRKLLDSSLGRIVELKDDLVNIDMEEFNYNDKILEKFRLTPFDIELKIPRYFERDPDRQKDIEWKKRFIESLWIKFGWLDNEEKEEQLTVGQAIKIIQMHERARQGRLRAQFMKEIRMLKEKGKPDGSQDRTDGLVAAMRIQKLWRGYATRQKTRRRKLQEMYLIGMVKRPNRKNLQLIDEMEKYTRERYEVQRNHQLNYETALIDIKETISKNQGVAISERIGDDIREWFYSHKNKTGKLPEFPTEEMGGSKHALSRQATESEISRSSAPSSKDSKKTKDKSRSPTKSADLNVDENLEIGFKLSESMFLPDIKAGIDEYNETWCNKDEATNPHQTHYEDIIYTDKYNEVEQQLRLCIDEMMRQELDILQAALDRDRAAKGKKGKKSAKKPRRSGKKGKKKKEKDLTPDRTTESLFEELVTNGIIKYYPETRLKSFIGDRAYAVRSGMNPTPGDIRQAIIEYCILPLGSEHIRNFAPNIRSLLITGPSGSGKKTLIKSICTEIGAMLFDLSPGNIVGKYPGKSGLIMLIHLVLKVSRLLQPAVIFMDSAEKPFMKKLPKGDRTDPKRLKKDLSKLVKNIQPEDRVMFIGISAAPWEADQKLLQQVYSRYLYIPRPDFGVLSFVWKEELHERCGDQIPYQFDFGAMAKISDGYTVGSVIHCIKEVLTVKRILQLRVQKLTYGELINALCTKDPVYREEEDAYHLWWEKTPLGRRKQKVLEMEAQRALDAKEKENKKKKSAKK